jgi:hypothetical protein
MLLDKFCTISNGKVSFTRHQASSFAKQIADDFNPLHDEDAKRFCVPGDLLFSLALARSGLSQQMTFTFSGMVTDGIELTFPDNNAINNAIIDDKNKKYVSICIAGNKTSDTKTINALTQAYVAFSGRTFPQLLVALMAKNKVMINPTRPMIMYESMSIHLDTLNFSAVELVLASSTLSIDGKRGTADLIFNLISAGKIIGHGKKHMILSGLRPYEQNKIDEIISSYNIKKSHYLTTLQ